MRCQWSLSVGVLLLMSTAAFTQQDSRPQPKTIPDSINYIMKDIERDFTDLAEAMPEDKWSFKPTQGEFKGARTFAEQVKHVACANEAWAKQIKGSDAPPDRCDLGGKAEILAYLRSSFAMVDNVRMWRVNFHIWLEASLVRIDLRSVLRVCATLVLTR